MTAALGTASSTSLAPPPGDVAQMAAALTQAFTALLGWDPQVGTVTFPSDHQTLGWNGCLVAGCGKPQTTANQLCPHCTLTWQEQGRPNLEVFLAVTTRARRRPGRSRCTVPGCERPWKGPKATLCQAHDKQRQKLGLELEAFRVHPEVVPRRSLGTCHVLACTRERSGGGRYCSGHDQRWRKAHQHQPGLDRDVWQREERPISEDNVLSLRGLPERVVLEFLYGLQQRTTAGGRTRFGVARPLVNQARSAQVSSLTELPPDGMQKAVRGLRNSIVRAVEDLACPPVVGSASVQWSLGSVGHPGMLRFGEIRQPWLREAVQAWALDELPKRRGVAVAQTLQGQINSVIRLSASLHRHRADHGADHRLLGRDDMTRFLNWLAYLTAQDEISTYVRFRDAYNVKRIVRRLRTLGLTRPGQPLHGIPEEFTLSREDMPPIPDDDDELGRDIPTEVVAVLTAHLGDLDGRGCSEIRTAIELLIDTGRRPNEICSLPLDCLERDQDGKPVLIYDNHKAQRLRRRLPISEVTAQTIVTQQDRVRSRFTDTPPDQLKLLPAPTRNPDGRRPVTHDWVSTRHRQWVAALPELTAPVAVQVDGRTVTRHLPFPKSRVILYAWRHTYAQRHADAGVPVDVLCDLMDHRDMGTTQGYYRVGETRRRDAVDRVTTMQFDRHGNRTWRQVSALLDTERLRRAVGEVAVPYGVCTEPSNVAAGGQDCPIRFRCVGCGHFRTDVSYLPDLEAYLADLLRHRERLLAATPQIDADDWARAEAMPSDEEIRRVRVLIGRVKADLATLDEDDRTQIEHAVATVRRARTSVVSLGLPRTRPSNVDTPREQIS